MYVTMFKSKIHRAKVTDANLNYVGSISIDADLMKKADILENEKVQVLNLNNGARFETYAIPAENKSGVICVNGAAARLVQKDDRVIIIAYALMEKNEAKNLTPSVIVVDDNNKSSYD